MKWLGGSLVWICLSAVGALAQQPALPYTCDDERATLREQLNYTVTNTTHHVSTVRNAYEKQLAAKDRYIAELKQEIEKAKTQGPAPAPTPQSPQSPQPQGEDTP